MLGPWQAVTDFRQQADRLAKTRYGRISIEQGRLKEIRLRPWPKLVSLPEVYLAERWFHRRATGDQAWLYYNQPWTAPGYLSLVYVVSTRDCSWRTARAGLLVLDEIAKLKQTLAIVCEAAGAGLTDRLAQRCGYERHLPDSQRRHYIRRFYGEFPTPPAVLAHVLGNQTPDDSKAQVAVSDALPVLSGEPTLT